MVQGEFSPVKKKIFCPAIPVSTTDFPDGTDKIEISKLQF
jgi:hypothetical protein